MKLGVHFLLNISEDLEHHGNNDVKNDPLHDDIEDHEVDTRPGTTCSVAHRVSDRGPVVDNHEGIQSRHGRAQVIEVDQVVKVIGDTVLTVEVGLKDLATKAVHANDSEEVVDDIEASKHVQDGHGHFHNHLHDNLEGFDFLKENSQAKVTKHECECEQGSTSGILSVFSVRVEHVEIGPDGDSLAEELDEVELLLSNDGASTSSEDDHSALEEVDAGDGQGEQLPEAGSDCLDLFELVVDDEEKRDSEVQQDKSDLHPSVEESLRALFKRELTLLVNIVAIISSHLQRVNILQISNLNEVGKAEELLDAGKLALLVMVDVDDLKDLSCCVAMRLVVIVEVEDILKELLSFVTIKIIVLVDVVVVEELFNILEAFRDTSATLGLKSRHVLVEDICEEQIGQEV